MKTRAAARRRRGVQLTVRDVPEPAARALRLRAKRENTSVNRILVEAVVQQSGGGAERRYDDLDWLAGTWVEDPGFDAAIAAQDEIDEDLWR